MDARIGKTVQVPKDLGDRAGLKGKVQLAEKYGGGYFATIEFVHQLHCLVSRFQSVSCSTLNTEANVAKLSGSASQSFPREFRVLSQPGGTHVRR